MTLALADVYMRELMERAGLRAQMDAAILSVREAVPNVDTDTLGVLALELAKEEDPTFAERLNRISGTAVALAAMAESGLRIDDDGFVHLPGAKE